MRNVGRRKRNICVIGLFAFILVFTLAAETVAQQGLSVMMSSCAMCGKGPCMMSMKGEPGPGHGGKHPSSASLMKILHRWGRDLFAQSDKLGLTEQQTGEIESILTSHVKAAIRKKADLKVLLIEIQELLVQEDVDLKEVKNKLKAMEALNTELTMEGIETLQKALAVLTPEQQKTVKGLFKKSTFMRMGMMPQGMSGSGMMQEMTGHGCMMKGMTEQDAPGGQTERGPHRH
ncbi:MAG: periplasmic heavy metal sensor [Deltaproteobacteria bacterium]|jgi:Spy/CpxP family protein refolding chaperone